MHFCLFVYSDTASISADVQGCIPHGARFRMGGGGVRLHAAPPDTWKSVKGKSALLAELLVQLVFIRKTRTSCRCHDGVFFFPPRTVAGVRNARCVAADGRTSGHSLRPPLNLRTVRLLAGARTRLQTRSQARNNAHGSGWWWVSVRERPGRTDSLNTTHAGDVSSPHDALPLIKKGKRGEKKWIRGASVRWLRSSASHYESMKWDYNPDTRLSFSLAAF